LNFIIILNLIYILMAILPVHFRVIRGFMSHTNKGLNEVKGNIASDNEAY